ncbi:MAG: dihydroxyacetone kinase family protein [Microbacterium sp.]|nr:MAG: dihydroxyacetone kinase family protein [Microbacterium sp.]
MTVLFNDPAEFAEEQLEGFVELYADRLRGVPGGVVAHHDGDPIVAVVVGGGSGHYPAFAGLVGPGFAAGAVVGNIFTSPSAAHVYSVAKAADQGRGVILTFGNYAGDVMNFGIAAERLRREGIDTRIVLVTDDVASSPDPALRRGVAGDFPVFKAMGAAAAEGMTLDEVERVGRAANDATRSMGVAFGGCTMPGAMDPLFDVARDTMSIGLGIHGEPGIQDVARASAREVAQALVSGVVADRPVRSGDRLAVIVNGLGSTKYEELFLLWREVSALLHAQGAVIVEPEVGELVTSLDMNACSLTVLWLDDEQERLWRADAYAPGYRKLSAPVRGLRPRRGAAADADALAAPDASDAARELAAIVRAALVTARDVLHEHAVYLGDIDAVAGDGDHGRGMVRGIDAAVAAADRTSGGGAWLLRRAGRAWAEQAGGTSGVLWGAGLEAAADALGDDRDTYDRDALVDATRAFADAIMHLGGAEPGDKTIVDALVPFVDTVREAAAAGHDVRACWAQAASVSVEAATGTTALLPKKGRARPLAARSQGTPDPGAVSFSLLARGLGDR